MIQLAAYFWTLDLPRTCGQLLNIQHHLGPRRLYFSWFYLLIDPTSDLRHTHCRQSNV